MVALLAEAVRRTATSALRRVEQVIDVVHLARMTLGDRSLENEVLGLFDRQAGMLLTRMKDAGPNVIAALAHTLKGSARGIGAWQVADAAEAIELAAASHEDAELDRAVERLSGAVGEVRSVIAEMLRAH